MELNYSDKYPELEIFIKGSTWIKLFRFLYDFAQLRYATKEHLNQINNVYGTHKKLTHLVKEKYLSVKNGDIYHITEKTRKLLGIEGFNTKILQSDFTGEVLKHELKITDCLLKLRKEPNFYGVFYPSFKELKPDACLIYAEKEDYKKNNSKILRYKIQFLEVEDEKGNWEQHLKNKRDKYILLARDFYIWDKWWRHNCERLELPFCKVEDFCFSVLCVANIEPKEWEGWQWQRV